MDDIQFSEAEKEEMTFKDTFFKYGVHKVQVDGRAIERDDQDRAYMEIGVVDPDNSDITTTVRMWLHTEGARKFTFNTLRNIYVHNAPEDQKEAARKTFDAIKDGTDLLVALDKVIGGEAWIDVYPDPERTYQNAKGETKPSINTNIYGYEPKLKPELIPDTQKQVDPADFPEGDANDEPFGSHEEEMAKKKKGGSASKTVPSKW